MTLTKAVVQVPESSHVDISVYFSGFQDDSSDAQSFLNAMSSLSSSLSK